MDPQLDKTASIRENDALRSFLAGRQRAVAAAESAGIATSSFLDLVERVRMADAGVSQASNSFDEAPPRLSVVIPVYNEAENIRPLLDRLLPVLQRLGTHEVIFVDDGSTDGSQEVVQAARQGYPAVKLVELSRNFGHQAALTAGLEFARGSAVVLMDADLQDPPELLPALVSRWDEGNDVVYAVRQARKEGGNKAPIILRLLSDSTSLERHSTPP